MRTHSRRFEFLLVEDNPGDIRLTREALKEGQVRVNLTIARDGVEALQLLRGNGEGKPKRCMPDLILLDLNLPRMDGRELLAQIKTDPELRHIPVVVLTTSSAEKDVLRAYDLHANCFITKPVELERFIEVVRSIDEFWLKMVRLPRTLAA